MHLHDSAREGDRDSLLALLNGGCDVDVVDDWQRTPAHVRCSMGSH